MVEKKKYKKVVGYLAKKYSYGWVALILFLGAGLAPLVYVLNIYKGDTRCQWVTHSGIASGCDPDGFKGLYIIASCMWLTASILLLYMISTKKGVAVKWHFKKK